MSTFEFTSSQDWGGVPIARRVADALPRRRLIANGRIIAAGFQKDRYTEGFRCTLDDHTGEVDLIFLGRTNIPGLQTGSTCIAEGTVGEIDGRLVLLNPKYKIEPQI